ncbi:putative fibrillin [Caerostris extrusa]|uniref:Fibrillin n=1 Tax=Caerostris extrusa TaxID=172846 RepID=A0AAV4Y9U4_CAEEX|nr:putative fibrillin [Caerostris extrusa]
MSDLYQLGAVLRKRNLLMISVTVNGPVYGGELILIGDYSQNNFTSKVAIKSLRDSGEISYWIGLTSVDGLSTNTLESSSGSFVSKYVGFWDHDQPQPHKGECVRAKIKGESQVWELAPCETLLPFICHLKACHRAHAYVCIIRNVTSAEDKLRFVRDEDVEVRFRCVRDGNVEVRFRCVRDGNVGDRFRCVRDENVEDRFRCVRDGNVEDRFRWYKMKM